MECGPLPQHLPSITGKSTEALLKELWSHKISVREDVERAVKSFINMARISNEVVSAFVIGEWGEGKTSIFDGYVKALAKDFALYSISARRLVDAVRALKGTAGESAAAIFLAALLHSLAMEYEERGERIIPKYSGESAHEYAQRALDELIKVSGNEKIIIFIDEFEEIVSPRNKDVVSEVLNGLVELINGEFGYLEKKYPGMLHLMVAMTPYAYNKALTLANIDESLKGRTERRLHYKIELRPLTRSEAYKLVGSMLRYAYGKAFSPVPSEFFNTVYTISQGNPGALTSLVNVIVSSLLKGECTEVTRDPSKLLNILANTTIFTYVGSSRAFDKTYFEKVLLPLTRNEEEEKVLNALVAYYYPLTKQEIAELAGVKNSEIIDILDQRASVTTSPLLMKFWRTSEYQRAFVILLETLRGIFPDAEEDELKRMLEEFTYPKSPWSKDYFLVIPDSSSSETLEDVISDKRAVAEVTKLATFLKKKLEDNGIKLEEVYMLSKNHVVNLYPPPAVSAVSFIRDPQARAKAWKEALNAITKGDVNLDKTFAEVISETLNGKIVGKYVTASIPVGGKVVNITIFPKVVLFIDSGIKKVVESAKKDGVNVAIILTKNDIAKKLEEMLVTSPIDYFVIGVKDAKLVQMAVYNLYSSPERRTLVDVERAHMMLKELGNEIMIKNILEKWAKKAYEEGIIVDDIPRLSGASEDTIAEAYTFYLAYPKNVMTTEEVFNHVVKIVRKFMIYGRGSRRRVPFATGLDVESVSSLKRFEDDLIAAGLLKRLEDGRLKLTMSKVEERILNILRSKGRSLWKNLEREFIIMANNKRILQDFYLKILERRGLVKVERKGNEVYLVELMEPQSIAYALEKELGSLEEQWRKSGYKWKTYAHMVVSKKKEDNLILLDEIKEYVEVGTMEIRGESNILTISRRASFLLNLTKYLKHQLMPVTFKAFEEASRMIEKTEEQLNEIKVRLNDLVNKALVIGRIPSVPPEEYEEVRNLMKILTDMMEVDNKKYTKSELQEMVRRLRAEEVLPELFYFEKFYEQRLWSQADYFNLKYHALRELRDEFLRKMRSYEKMIDDAIKTIKSIENKEREVIRRLEEIASEGYNTKISSRIYSWIKELATIKGKSPEEVAISLRNLVEMLKFTEHNVGMFDEKILNAFHMLDKVKEKELTVMQGLAYLKMWKTFFEKFYSGTPYERESKKIDVVISELYKRYDELLDSFPEPVTTSQLITTMEGLLKKLDTLISEINTYNNNLRTTHEKLLQKLQNDLRTIKKSLGIIKKVNRNVEVPASIIDIEMKLRKVLENAPTSIEEGVSYMKLTKSIEGLRAYIKIIMKDVLSTEEEMMLEILGTKGEWKLEEVLRVAEERGLSKAKAIDALVSLGEKGLIESKVKLR